MLHISIQKIEHLAWIKFLIRRWQVCVWLTVWHSSNWQESVELSHQTVLMQLVEEFHLITVFKIQKNKPKDFLLSNLMKIIEHVMLFSYLGEKKKKLEGKRVFSKDMLKSLTSDSSQSLVSGCTFFSDSCMLCKVEKSVCCEKKNGGEGVAQ